MRSPFAKVNAQLRKLGCNVKLLRGRGYIYFITTEPTPFDSESIYWNDFTSKDVPYLVTQGAAFEAQVRARHATN